MYLSDLEETIEKWQAGGIKISNVNIWSLSYADGIVLLAKTSGEMKDMMKRFEKYIKQKNMLLSPTKSKIVEFRTGRGREKKEQ